MWKELSKSRELSSRAAETLVLFMTAVMVAGVVVAPQPATAVGAELPALAVVAGAILVGIAGVSVVVRAGGGLYWLIPAVAATLIGGVVNAWIFLVRLPS